MPVEAPVIRTTFPVIFCFQKCLIRAVKNSYTSEASTQRRATEVTATEPYHTSLRGHARRWVCVVSDGKRVQNIAAWYRVLNRIVNVLSLRAPGEKAKQDKQALQHGVGNT